MEMAFAEALDWEHVGMPVDSAVQVRLVRAAAEQGRSLNFRVIVSNFESARETHAPCPSRAVVGMNRER
ncbi:MAG TPA: hypothetical protein VKD22_02195, partial [Ramlibacter sp.]|nr:hypothetical protein [Ramlibacter sp.]